MTRRNNKSGRKRSPFVFGLLFRIVLIAAAVAIGLSYVAVYVNPSHFALPLFFGLFYIPILAVNLLLLAIAALHRSPSAWITVAALLPSLLFTDLFFKIGPRSGIQEEGIALKIETYNVGMFSSAEGKRSRNDCRNLILNHIRKESPDIVCLQEFFADNLEQADTLFSQYPHRHYHLFRARNGKLFGNLILSRFPIRNKGVISFRNSTNLSIYADIEHYGREIRIYNNHLESYNVSFAALVQKFSKSENLDKEAITHDLKETHDRMLGTFIRRSDQVNTILKDINRSSAMAIICGDFNDTPMSYAYHTLAKNRKDSFKEAGKGFGGTFIPVWPLLRIDYVLMPQEAECISHTIHKIRYSDHYPVTSILNI